MPNFIKQSRYTLVPFILGLLVSTLFISTTSCKREGCTDSLANNYDEKAKEDDGSCTYDNTNTVNVKFVPTFLLFNDVLYDSKRLRYIYIVNTTDQIG